MSSIYVNTNDNNRPRFEPTQSFFGIDYDVPGPLVARVLACQHIADVVAATLHGLVAVRMSSEKAQKDMEAMWEEVAEIVRRFDGESAATKQSTKDTEAPTSAPSAVSSGKPASSSSMKRKATRST